MKNLWFIGSILVLSLLACSSRETSKFTRNENNHSIHSDHQLQEYLSELTLVSSEGDVQIFRDSINQPEWVRFQKNRKPTLVVANQFLIHFKKSSSQLEEHLTNSMKQLDLDLAILNNTSLGLVSFEDPKRYDTIYEQLMMNPSLLKVEANAIGFGGNNERRLKPPSPDDEFYSSLWGLQRMSTPKIWNEYPENLCDEVVWILDTGTDLDHEDIKNNIWQNPSELNGQTGVDDDGNGFVDDVFGWDFVNGDNNPNDDHGHGSHIAGIIAAERNNAIGISGICSDAKIASIKVLNAQNRFTLDALISGLNYIASMNEHSKIVNASLGLNFYSSLVEDAFGLLRDKEMLVIVAAMNESWDLTQDGDFYPAEFDMPNIITVSNLAQDGSLHPSSNFGVGVVDIAAPGTDIYSLNHFGEYSLLTGSSQATPHVSGVAALIQSQFPDSSFTFIKSRILETALPNEKLKGLHSNPVELNAYCAFRGIAPCTNEEALAITISGQKGYQLTRKGNRIIVKNAKGMSIQIFDIDGKLSQQKLITTNDYVFNVDDKLYQQLYRINLK